MMVTEAELQTILQPLTIGYAWGADTIGDLWRMGAPTPHDNTRRIVFPNKLAEWLEDVLERQGRPLDESARVYNNLRKVSG